VLFISLLLYCKPVCHICCSRQAGHRFGEHLERVIPLIVKYAKIDGDDELREYCIQVSFSARFALLKVVQGRI
jgi:hypothetical protein